MKRRINLVIPIFPDKPVPKTYGRLETDPYFIGAPGAWQAFLNAHVKRDDITTDSVLIRFIVRNTGGISNINVAYFKDPATRDEAVRLLKLSCPYWVPSNVEGRNVHVWFEQAFIFKVAKQEDHSTISVKAVTPFPARPRIFPGVLRSTVP